MYFKKLLTLVICLSMLLVGINIQTESYPTQFSYSGCFVGYDCNNVSLSPNYRITSYCTYTDGIKICVLNSLEDQEAILHYPFICIFIQYRFSDGNNLWSSWAQLKLNLTHSAISEKTISGSYGSYQLKTITVINFTNKSAFLHYRINSNEFTIGISESGSNIFQNPLIVMVAVSVGIGIMSVLVSKIERKRFRKRIKE